MSYRALRDLQVALDSGRLDNGTIERITEQMIVEEKLNNHRHKVWRNKTNGRYLTYVDTENGRKLISKKSREDLANSLENTASAKVRVRKQMLETIFNEWVERKLKYHEIKKQSYDKYKNDFDRFFKNGVVDISKQPIGTFTEIDLEDFIKENVVHYNLTRKTYGSLRTLIIGVWKFGKKLGYTDLSISTFFGDLQLPKNIFKPRNRKPSENVFTDSEVSMIREHIDKLQNPSVLDYGVLLAFFTGMRAGEIVALKWEDIDTDVIHITKTEERIKDESGKYIYRIRRSGKTEASTRDLILTDQAKSILKKLRMINPFGNFIFEENGVRYNSKKLTVRLYQICDRLNLTRRSLHKARKTYITKLINARVDETVIITQAGHTDITTTRQYYEFNNKTLDEQREQIKKAFVV